MMGTIQGRKGAQRPEVWGGKLIKRGSGKPRPLLYRLFHDTPLYARGSENL